MWMTEKRAWWVMDFGLSKLIKRTQELQNMSPIAMVVSFVTVKLLGLGEAGARQRTDNRRGFCLKCCLNWERGGTWKKNNGDGRRG